MRNWWKQRSHGYAQCVYSNAAQAGHKSCTKFNANNASIGTFFAFLLGTLEWVREVFLGRSRGQNGSHRSLPLKAGGDGLGVYFIAFVQYEC